MTTQREIVESSGAQWVGIQETDGDPLCLFRDPVTGTGCAVKENSLTREAVDRKLKAARERFGIKL